MNVVVGLSGGIDSAVSVYLLKKKGYNVIGITMLHIDTFDVDKVKYVAKKLDIPLFIYDIRREFKEKIINPFIKEYLKGKTPNPCIFCNPYIKFGILKDLAKSHGELFATGHYIKKEKKEGIYFIKRGKDKKKDQSYFLYRIKQKDLQETLFPLGEYTKEEVKKIGTQLLGLSPRKESQDICFIKDSYKKLIIDRAKDIKKGEFITQDGKILGIHKGIPFYTIGQRRGLGISSKERLYVIEILSHKNKIILGPKEDLIRKEFIIEDFSSPSYKKLPKDKIYEVKVRYNASGKKTKIEYISDNRIKVVLLENGEYAITPGQSAVFYESEYLIGGGIILS